jgi:hypothetical protein
MPANKSKERPLYLLSVAREDEFAPLISKRSALSLWLKMFPIWFLAAIVLLIMVVVVMRRLGERPIPYRALLLVDANRFLESFLQQSDVGSVFVLERESGPGFLQLAVTDRRRSHREIEFGLPDAEWCRGRFDFVHKAMETEGHTCRLEANHGNLVPRFLRVRIGGNHDELTPVLIQVLTLAAGELGFDTEDRYTLRMNATISAEYMRDLAEQLEQMPRGGGIGRALAAWLLRSAKKDHRE